MGDDGSGGGLSTLGGRWRAISDGNGTDNGNGTVNNWRRLGKSCNLKPPMPKSDPSKRTDRAQRRKRKRERAKANNWRLHPTAPTPYERWKDAEVANAYRESIQTALDEMTSDGSNGSPSKGKGAVDLSYRKDKGRRSQTLTVDELAVGLFAVKQVGKRGISHGQLKRAFAVCGVGWSGAKAGPIFRALVALGLIRKVANYSAFKGNQRGNCYELVKAQSNISAPWD